jgi:hypothetical protein
MQEPGKKGTPSGVPINSPRPTPSRAGSLQPDRRDLDEGHPHCAPPDPPTAPRGLSAKKRTDVSAAKVEGRAFRRANKLTPPHPIPSGIPAASSQGPRRGTPALPPYPTAPRGLSAENPTDVSSKKVEGHAFRRANKLTPPHPIPSGVPAASSQGPRRGTSALRRTPRILRGTPFSRTSSDTRGSARAKDQPTAQGHREGSDLTLTICC